MSVPQLRFKDDDGWEFSAWRVVQFGKFCIQNLGRFRSRLSNYMALAQLSLFAVLMQVK